MTPGPGAADDPEPVLPRYGSRSLGDLLPAVAARLGVRGCSDVLELPDADRWVLLLVDGLGDRLLAEHAVEAPYLASLHGSRPALTVGVPSTTATSITSLGTGLAPGRHGVTGYTSRIPGTLRLLNALTWDGSVDPGSWQPHRSVFATMALAGVEATVVSRTSFQGSGLTQASQRGARYIGSDTPQDRVDDVADVVEAASRAGRGSLTYAYESQLDHIGHEEGCRSAAWREVLRAVDADALALRAVLPPGTALVVTGDHGMVDVPGDDRVDADEEPDLRDGVVLLGGEARFRQLWTEAGATDDVAACWRERCGPRAWVVTRDEAEAAGWFGAVADEVRPRIGDVLVASRGTFAALASQQFSVETRMVGFHGSLTGAEMYVPLLVDVVGG
jgi:Type I phosphodiesterase / nucleotide pyrophosphatase